MQIGVLLTAQMLVVFGPRLLDLSQLPTAFVLLFQGLIIGGDTGEGRLIPFLRSEAMGGPLSNPATQGLAWIMLIFRPLLFGFLLVRAAEWEKDDLCVRLARPHAVRVPLCIHSKEPAAGLSVAVAWGCSAARCTHLACVPPAREGDGHGHHCLAVRGAAARLEVRPGL